MSKAKEVRHDAIRQLIQSKEIESQEQLVAELQADGKKATQATVSRDLAEIGVARERRGDRNVYVIPQRSDQPANPDHLHRVLGEYVEDVAHSANLVVLRADPGSAHVVGSALDRAKLNYILGTVAGDDTLIVVAPETIGVGRSKQAGGLVCAQRMVEFSGAPFRTDPAAALQALASGMSR